MRLTLPAHVVITDVKQQNRISRLSLAYAMGRFFIRYHGKRARSYYTAISVGNLLTSLKDKIDVFMSKPTQIIDVELFDDFDASKYSSRLYCCLDNQILALNTQSVCESILSSMNATVPSGTTPCERLFQLMDLEKITPDVAKLIQDMENNSVYTEEQVNVFISLIARSSKYTDRVFLTRVYQFAKSFKSVLYLNVFLAFMLALNHYNVNRRITRLANLISKVTSMSGEAQLLACNELNNSDEIEIVSFDTGDAING